MRAIARWDILCTSTSILYINHSVHGSSTTKDLTTRKCVQNCRLVEKRDQTIVIIPSEDIHLHTSSS